jgi:predicted TIM-barrel fold metal-dependent hydrolase
MRIRDCHVHVREPITVDLARDWLEHSICDVAHVFSQDPEQTPDGGRRAIADLVGVAREFPEQIVPMAWIDPAHCDAPKIAEWAAGEAGVRGFKMIPQSWYPDDPRARKIYEIAEAHRLPIQFHSGILWQIGDRSKYCRPAGYEVMMDYPGLRFSMAHIGWPWTDECIAVAQKFRMVNQRAEDRDPYQAMVDLTVGTPKIYREDALRKCLACCGADLMMFGTDAGIGRRYCKEWAFRNDEALLRDLGCTEEELQMIFAGNAERFIAGTPPAE